MIDHSGASFCGRFPDVTAVDLRRQVFYVDMPPAPDGTDVGLVPPLRGQALR